VDQRHRSYHEYENGKHKLFITQTKYVVG
jgi:hypothetical protein